MAKKVDIKDEMRADSKAMKEMAVAHAKVVLEEPSVGIGHTQVPEGMTIFELTLFQAIDLETDEIIKKLTEMYPETLSGFKEYMIEEFITFCKKQYDYGPGNISVGTQLKDEKEKLISLKGLWFRMSDKISRLFNIILVRDSLESSNESLDDTYLDLAVYSKIAKLVINGHWAK